MRGRNGHLYLALQEEVEQICTRIAILDKGRVIARVRPMRSRG